MCAYQPVSSFSVGEQWTYWYKNWENAFERDCLMRSIVGDVLLARSDRGSDVCLDVLIVATREEEFMAEEEIPSFEMVLRILPDNRYEYLSDDNVDNNTFGVVLMYYMRLVFNEE